MDALSILPRIVAAALNGDQDTLRKGIVTVIRALRKDRPELSDELSRLLALSRVNANYARSLGLESLPTDMESNFTLLKADDVFEEEGPILDEHAESAVNNFIRERREASKLLAQGLLPSTSLLVVGPPGVGKTYLVRWLAKKLDMPLLTVDLAGTISSYLGRTGLNLKRIFEYAKRNPCVLLLDEFDAVAKRRDDPTDIGELKRVVNVLLKEIEEWPSNSVLAAASNHPQLLDEAVWRRFDCVIKLGLPERAQRIRILNRYLQEPLSRELDQVIFRVMVDLSASFSPAALRALAERIRKRVILGGMSVSKAAAREIALELSNSDSSLKGSLCRALKKEYGNGITVTEIASLLELSPSTVSYHLKKGGD